MKDLIIFTFLAVVSSTLLAQTPEEMGLNIFQRIDEREKGYGDSIVDITMILKNANNDMSIRVMEIKTLEQPNDGDKSLTIIKSPKDVKGTALLSYSHALSLDEQWLYLPALKRIKRISSSNKSGSFLGSEYAYEDITTFQIEKFEYLLIKEEIYDNKNCFVVELTPLFQYSGYSRLLVWVDASIYIILKTEYYDRKNELLKTQYLKDYQQYYNKFWRSLDQLMINNVNEKSTRLLFENYQFQTGLTERNFDQNSLKRSR